VPGELSGGGREMDSKGNSALLSKIGGSKWVGKLAKGTVEAMSWGERSARILSGVVGGGWRGEGGRY
jgi:hypothetical protein